MLNDLRNALGGCFDVVHQLSSVIEAVGRENFEAACAAAHRGDLPASGAFDTVTLITDQIWTVAATDADAVRLSAAVHEKCPSYWIGAVASQRFEAFDEAARGEFWTWMQDALQRGGENRRSVAALLGTDFVGSLDPTRLLPESVRNLMGLADASPERP